MPIVIGIDPGSRITGYGVLQYQKLQPTVIDYGHITVQAKDNMATRLNTIHDALKKLIEKYQAQEVAIESVFMHANVQSAIKLGQARGAALAACGAYALDLYEYSPKHIKKAVAGYGAAQKAQIQTMVRHLLQLKCNPQADAADALAVALCHVYQANWQQSIEKACQKA